ncbi:MAG TPA: zinc ribbon domain-containing protein [Anaerolineales bacterium]|nr:zinc ribbon domain-containing protein [Anaerolineales bacterium]
MAKKRIGYVELHWECPNCGTINPGPVKVCKGCGAPQPEDVEFFQASRQELIQEEEKIKQASAGADIHCAYCGTRNPAGAASCSQCEADLSEGHQRKAGRVVGAFKSGPAQKVQCPNCGTENLESESRCTQCGGRLPKPASTTSPDARTQAAVDRLPKASPQGKRSILPILGLILVVACAAIYFIFLRTTATMGTVTDVGWERAVAIEGMVPVEFSDWFDQIPSDGENISCTSEERSRSETPVEGAVEECTEPETEDTGTGYGEVVAFCEYVVYDDFCTYTVLDWGVVETVSSSGDDFFPLWPDPDLAADQRLGEGEENYKIYFSADGDEYVYTTSDFELFQQAQIGTEWELEINSIGGVQSINP